MNPTCPLHAARAQARAPGAFDLPLTRDPPASLPALGWPAGGSEAAIDRHHDLARLHDEARARAHALRAEAMQDFWRHADHLLAHVAGQAARSASRLAARLARHRAHRHGSAGAAAATTPCRA
jgi:hypothetical protein